MTPGNSEAAANSQPSPPQYVDTLRSDIRRLRQPIYLTAETRTVLTDKLTERFKGLSPDDTRRTPQNHQEEMDYIKGVIKSEGYDPRAPPFQDPDKLWMLTDLEFLTELWDIYPIIRSAQLRALGADVNPNIDAEELHQTTLNLGPKVLNYLNDRQMLFGNNAVFKLLEQEILEFETEAERAKAATATPAATFVAEPEIATSVQADALPEPELVADIVEDVEDRPTHQVTKEEYEQREQEITKLLEERLKQVDSSFRDDKHREWALTKLADSLITKFAVGTRDEYWNLSTRDASEVIFVMMNLVNGTSQTFNQVELNPAVDKQDPTISAIYQGAMDYFRGPKNEDLIPQERALAINVARMVVNTFYTNNFAGRYFPGLKTQVYRHLGREFAEFYDGMAHPVFGSWGNSEYGLQRIYTSKEYNPAEIDMQLRPDFVAFLSSPDSPVPVEMGEQVIRIGNVVVNSQEVLEAHRYVGGPKKEEAVEVFIKFIGYLSRLNADLVDQVAEKSPSPFGSREVSMHGVVYPVPKDGVNPFAYDINKYFPNERYIWQNQRAKILYRFMQENDLSGYNAKVVGLMYANLKYLPLINRHPAEPLPIVSPGERYAELMPIFEKVIPVIEAAPMLDIAEKAALMQIAVYTVCRAYHSGQQLTAEQLGEVFTGVLNMVIADKQNRYTPPKPFEELRRYFNLGRIGEDITKGQADKEHSTDLILSFLSSYFDRKQLSDWQHKPNTPISIVKDLCEEMSDMHFASTTVA